MIHHNVPLKVLMLADNEKFPLMFCSTEFLSLSHINVIPLKFPVAFKNLPLMLIELHKDLIIFFLKQLEFDFCKNN